MWSQSSEKSGFSSLATSKAFLSILQLGVYKKLSTTLRWCSRMIFQCHCQCWHGFMICVIVVNLWWFLLWEKSLGDESNKMLCCWLRVFDVGCSDTSFEKDRKILPRARKNYATFSLTNWWKTSGDETNNVSGFYDLISVAAAKSFELVFHAS